MAKRLHEQQRQPDGVCLAAFVEGTKQAVRRAVDKAWNYGAYDGL